MNCYISQFTKVGKHKEKVFDATLPSQNSFCSEAKHIRYCVQSSHLLYLSSHDVECRKPILNLYQKLSYQNWIQQMYLTKTCVWRQRERGRSQGGGRGAQAPLPPGTPLEAKGKEEQRGERRKKRKEPPWCQSWLRHSERERVQYPIHHGSVVLCWLIRATIHNLPSSSTTL